MSVLATGRRSAHPHYLNLDLSRFSGKSQATTISPFFSFGPTDGLNAVADRLGQYTRAKMAGVGKSGSCWMQAAIEPPAASCLGLGGMRNVRHICAQSKPRWG